MALTKYSYMIDDLLMYDQHFNYISTATYLSVKKIIKIPTAISSIIVPVAKLYNVALWLILYNNSNVMNLHKKLNAVDCNCSC